MAPRLAVPVVLLASILLAGGLGAARAEGPLAQEKGGVFPVVEDLKTEDEAKAVRAALQEAVESKDEAKIVAAVAPMVVKRHKLFPEELRKLLADKRMPVAAAGADALGSQDDKGAHALLIKIVQSKTKDKGFYKDILLKAAAIESLGRLGVKTAADAILDFAEDQRLEPTLHDRAQPKAVKACVRYFGKTKEKRAVSYLLDEIDQPEPKDPNSGTNPGAEYWKKRHDTWVIIRPDVLWALKEITGLEHETGRRWKKWFDEEGKKGGYK